jgi:hypothetical protein
MRGIESHAGDRSGVDATTPDGAENTLIAAVFAHK